jgi:uncharacterized protein YggE
MERRRIMKKKVIAVMVAVLMLVMLMPTSALAESYSTEGWLTKTLTVTVSGHGTVEGLVQNRIKALWLPL